MSLNDLDLEGEPPERVVEELNGDLVGTTSATRNSRPLLRISDIPAA